MACSFVLSDLIDGPITHQKDMLPQFSLSHYLPPRTHDDGWGINCILIGLFKKVCMREKAARVWAAARVNASGRGAMP